MKNMKKILALVVATLMIVASMSAFAAGDGSIIINNAVAGHTYTAYQIFSGKWDANTSKLSDIKWGTGISTAGQSALYTAYSLTGDNQTAAKVADAIGDTDADAQAFANNIGEGANLGTGSTGDFGTGDAATTYTIPNLEDGYYMIVDTYTPASGEKDVYYARYMIQKVGNATVNNKADKPEVEKDIDKDNDLSTTNDRVDENTANIGDTVTYVITSRVPDMTGYKEYYMDFSDTLSKGLTYDAGSLSVSIGGTTLAADAYTLTVGDYSDTDGTSISVHLKDLVSRQYAKDANIVITYTAEVNDAAVIGNAGNPNTVKLIYSNNPRNSGDGTPDSGDDGVKGETPDSTVKTYVTELELVKVDKDNDTVKLAGAVFDVVGTEINKVLITGERFVEAADGTYWKLKDNKGYTTKAPNDQIKDQYESETIKYKKEAYAETSVQEVKDVAFQVVTGSDGVIKLTGLKEGTYTFTEIQAPDGYNLLDAPITVTITSNIDTKQATADFAWSATGAQETATGSGKFTFTVENGQGNTLPSTGGMGTTILYIGGSILVILAAVLLITKRRMSSEE